MTTSRADFLLNATQIPSSSDVVPALTAFGGRGLPDARFIKDKVPIADVAGELGLEVIGSMVRCWRPENHHHGDRTPSVGLDRKRNRIRCFLCDPRAYSAIDLVQKVMGLDTRGAINWIASRFHVPTIPKGRHLAKPDPFRSVSRSGLGGSLEAVIRSGLWANLTPSEKAVLPVLCGLSDQTTDGLQISYRGIRRFAGINSDTTVARVLNRFQRIHLLNIHGGPRTEGGLRPRNCYQLTLDDPRLLRLMTEFYECEQKEIQAERQSRQEYRNMKQRGLTKKPINSDASKAIPGSDELPTPA